MSAATSSIQPFGDKQYKKPDNIKSSTYIAMADLPPVKQLAVVAHSTKPAISYHFNTEPDSQQITGSTTVIRLPLLFPCGRLIAGGVSLYI